MGVCGATKGDIQFASTSRIVIPSALGSQIEDVLLLYVVRQIDGCA
jgi:hypothetical protein